MPSNILKNFHLACYTWNCLLKTLYLPISNICHTFQFLCSNKLWVSCGLVLGRFRVKSHQFLFLIIFKVSRFSLTESDVCLVIGFWCKLTCYSRNIQLKLFMRRKKINFDMQYLNRARKIKMWVDITHVATQKIRNWCIFLLHLVMENFLQHHFLWLLTNAIGWYQKLRIWLNSWY